MSGIRRRRPSHARFSCTPSAASAPIGVALGHAPPPRIPVSSCSIVPTAAPTFCHLPLHFGFCAVPSLCSSCHPGFTSCAPLLCQPPPSPTQPLLPCPALTATPSATPTRCPRPRPPLPSASPSRPPTALPSSLPPGGHAVGLAQPRNPHRCAPAPPSDASADGVFAASRSVLVVGHFGSLFSLWSPRRPLAGDLLPIGLDHRNRSERILKETMQTRLLCGKWKLPTDLHTMKGVRSRIVQVTFVVL